MPNSQSDPAVVRVSSYLRHRTRTRDRGYCYAYLADGSRVQRHLPGDYDSPESRRAYHEIAAGILAGVVAPRAPAATPAGSAAPILVSEVVARFHLWAAGYYVKHGRPTMEARNFNDACRPLLALYRDLPAAEFSVAKLELVRDAMVEQGNLCRKTINSRIRKVRAVFAWAVRKELVPPSIYHGLCALKALQPGRTKAPDRAGVEAVEWERVEAMLPHLPSPPLRAMVAFAWWTGARPDEVWALRWADVDRREASSPSSSHCVRSRDASSRAAAARRRCGERTCSSSATRSSARRRRTRSPSSAASCRASARSSVARRGRSSSRWPSSVHSSGGCAAARLANVAPPPEVRALESDVLEVLAVTGARRGEFARVRLEDVELEAGRVWIGSPKDRSNPRHAEVSSSSLEALERLAAHAAAMVRAAENPARLLIPDGEDELERILRRWQRLLEEPRLSGRTLRRSFLTAAAGAALHGPGTTARTAR